MTMFDDPNREAVGLAPIWTGAEEGGAEEGGGAAGSFDPGEHTVTEVEEYIAAHPDEADTVLAAEAAGKNRTTLTGG
jgi:hypothetical protein